MKYDGNMVVFERQGFLYVLAVTMFSLVEVTPQQWKRHGFPRLKLVQIVSVL